MNPLTRRQGDWKTDGAVTPTARVEKRTAPGEDARVGCGTWSANSREKGSIWVARVATCSFSGMFDLLMTYTLLRRGGGFYESNPIAKWWFARWNIAGMTIFKFLSLAVAIVASEVVERRRPGLGRGAPYRVRGGLLRGRLRPQAAPDQRGMSAGIAWIGKPERASPFRAPP